MLYKFSSQVFIPTMRTKTKFTSHTKRVKNYTKPQSMKSKGVGKNFELCD